MERTSVPFPAELIFCNSNPGIEMIGNNGQRVMISGDDLGIAAQELITDRELLQSIKVARIKLECALQIAQPFLLLAAPAQDVAGQFDDARIIRQRWACFLQFS